MHGLLGSVVFVDLEMLAGNNTGEQVKYFYVKFRTWCICLGLRFQWYSNCSIRHIGFFSAADSNGSVDGLQS